jgi:outer membrane lipoprotein SlyB
MAYGSPSFKYGWFLAVRSVKFGLPTVMLAALMGCTPDYSPNTYSANAVQQANKVETALVVGFRQVEISANGTVGAVSGGAAGGILGSQTGAIGFNSALGAVGGTAVGGLVGTAIEHATGDTTGWEYIVRKANGDLLSVTQREPMPIPLGQKVLVITGNQARIIPDYSKAVEPAPAPSHAPDKPKHGPEPAAAETEKPAVTPAPVHPATPQSVPAVEKVDLQPPIAEPPVTEPEATEPSVAVPVIAAPAPQPVPPLESAQPPLPAAVLPEAAVPPPAAPIPQSPPADVKPATSAAVAPAAQPAPAPEPSHIEPPHVEPPPVVTPAVAPVEATPAPASPADSPEAGDKPKDSPATPAAPPAPIPASARPAPAAAAASDTPAQQ